MKKTILLFAAIALVYMSGIAQPTACNTLSGRVTDSAGVGIANAQINIWGSDSVSYWFYQNSALTDINGYYYDTICFHDSVNAWLNVSVIDCNGNKINKGIYTYDLPGTIDFTICAGSGSDCNLIQFGASGNNESSHGACNGSAKAHISGGTPPYVYQWDRSAGSQTSQTATGLCAGTYHVTVTDNNGCRDTALVAVGTNNNYNTICRILSGQVSDSLGKDYPSVYVSIWGIDSLNNNWYYKSSVKTNRNGYYADTICFPDPGYAYINVAVTDCNGNFIQKEIPAYDLPAAINFTICSPNPGNGCRLSILANVDDETAPGACDGSAIIHPSGGTSPYFFEWGSSAGYQKTQTATGLCAGSYYVLVTDAKGCGDTTVVIVGSGHNSSTIACKLFINGNTTYNATVYLIEYNKDQNTLTAIDTAEADSSFIFNNVPAGKYLIKAALNPGHPDYDTYMPTYYGDVLYWADASSVTVPPSLYQVHINMVKGSNPGGPGFIGGHVLQGANKTEGEGEPMTGINILLLDLNDNPVAHTSSNSEGYFEFPSVPLGTIKVYAEIWGKTTQSSAVTLDENNPKIENIQIAVNENSITTNLIRMLNLFRPLIKIYPNPVTNAAKLEINSVNNDFIEMKVINPVGQILYNEGISVNAGTNTISLKMDNLMQGLYFIELKSSSGKINSTEKLLKQ